MEEKRYSIVRVDNRCPVEEEEDICLVDRIKMFPCFNDKRLSCKKCNYGDTKEQLIQKILQAIIIDIVKTAKVDDKKTIQILYKANYKLAKFIVECLGVK